MAAAWMAGASPVRHLHQNRSGTAALAHQAGAADNRHGAAVLQSELRLKNSVGSSALLNVPPWFRT